MSFKDYSLANPKTTGDTIWIDYNASREEPVVWHVGDVDRALAYWSNPLGLTEVERWAIGQSGPRPGKPQLREPEVKDELELFDAITRFTCSRKLRYRKRKEEKKERKRERKSRKKEKPVYTQLSFEEL